MRRGNLRVAMALVVLGACGPGRREPAGSFDRAEVERAVLDRMASYAAALEAAVRPHSIGALAAWL